MTGKITHASKETGTGNTEARGPRTVFSTAGRKGATALERIMKDIGGGLCEAMNTEEHTMRNNAGGAGGRRPERSAGIKPDASAAGFMNVEEVHAAAHEKELTDAREGCESSTPEEICSQAMGRERTRPEMPPAQRAKIDARKMDTGPVDYEPHEVYAAAQRGMQAAEMRL